MIMVYMLMELCISHMNFIVWFIKCFGFYYFAHEFNLYGMCMMMVLKFCLAFIMVTFVNDANRNSTFALCTQPCELYGMVRLGLACIWDK